MKKLLKSEYEEEALKKLFPLDLYEDIANGKDYFCYIDRLRAKSAKQARAHDADVLTFFLENSIVSFEYKDDTPELVKYDEASDKTPFKQKYEKFREDVKEVVRKRGFFRKVSEARYMIKFFVFLCVQSVILATLLLLINSFYVDNFNDLGINYVYHLINAFIVVIFTGLFLISLLFIRKFYKRDFSIDEGEINTIKPKITYDEICIMMKVMDYTVGDFLPDELKKQK